MQTSLILPPLAQPLLPFITFTLVVCTYTLSVLLDCRIFESTVHIFFIVGTEKALNKHGLEVEVNEGTTT